MKYISYLIVLFDTHFVKHTIECMSIDYEYWFDMREIIDSSPSIFYGKEQQFDLWCFLFYSSWTIQRNSSTLTTLLNPEAKVINRARRAKGSLFPKPCLLTLMDHNMLQSQREMLCLCFWLIMHFFPKLFIEDRFIIPICQAGKVFNEWCAWRDSGCIRPFCQA